MPTPTPAPGAVTADEIHACLHEALVLTHRAAMSGMQQIADWSDTLRTRNDLSPAAIVKHTEIIGRLGHHAARLMTTVQRAAITLDRLEHTAATRAAREK